MTIHATLPTPARSEAEALGSGLGWALIKATSSATHYSKVKIIRTGKRFTYVQTGAGSEWRMTTRGLWAFETEAAADAELDTLAQIWRDHMPVRRSRPTVRDVIARVLGEVDAAQYRPSGNHPSLTALAEMEREQRVFKMITDAGVLYQAKWGNQS